MDNAPCTECGTGYLLHQTYGFAEVPEGWTEVQRCDTCSVFDGDLNAARAAAEDKGDVAWGFFPAGDDLPGEFAIRWVEA
jgi:hypothetical protein